MRKVWIIQLIIFLSAFLLFQIELIIGKIFLPNFGGSYLVWGACVVFFQAALLGGYAFAHGVLVRLGIHRYRKMHLALILLPFLFFPGQPLPLKFQLFHWPMVLEVFWKLMLTIGPAFFVLSTISIIWQAWLAHSDLPEQKNPYTLFAVSNLGSFAALLTYPFLFELNFNLEVQQHLWRAGYLVLVLLQYLAFQLIKVDSVKKEKDDFKLTVSGTVAAQWMLYGAAGVMVFLATTNIITMEIAPVPLFWILPLAIYLLSFVLCFQQKPWTPGPLLKNVGMLVGFSVLFYCFMVNRMLPILVELVLLLVYLFALCLFCHFQFSLLRPASSQGLSLYYLLFSLGCFLGGVVATWIAPLLSHTPLEYFLGLFCLTLAWQIDEKRQASAVNNIFTLAAFFLIIWWGTAFIKQFKFWGLVTLFFTLGFVFYMMQRIRWGLVLCVLLVIATLHVIEGRWLRTNFLFQHRNYYGISKVFEAGGVKFLMQGTTIHGAQFLNPKSSFIPLTYYTPNSPGAELIIHEPWLTNIGAIGLGTGAIAAYLTPAHKLDFFELDPDVYDIAKNHFRYLNFSPGRVEHHFGDARLTLEGMEDRKYDFILVDAFSGDAVPIHLLTIEAIALYRKHLTPDGILMFHISNRNIDLRKPVFKTGFASGAFVVYKNCVDNISGVFTSDWVAMTWDPGSFRKLGETYAWQVIDPAKLEQVKVWSDKYSSVLPFLKQSHLLKMDRKIVY